MSDDTPQTPDDNGALDLSGLNFGPAWARDPSESKNLKKYKDRGDRDDKRGGGGRRDDRRGGGPRRDDRGGGGGGGFRGNQGGGGRGGRRDDDRRPQHQEVEPPAGVNMRLMPAEESLDLLAKRVVDSGQTFSVFDLAKVLLQSRDRFRVTFDSPEKTFFRCREDQSIWLTRDEAQRHLWSAEWLGKYYEEVKVEGDAPKGSFSSVARCGLSNELLGPPNYHGYQEKLLALHRERFSNMSLDGYKAKVRMERGEEAVEAWLESMKMVTKWKVAEPKSEEPEAKEVAAKEASPAKDAPAEESATEVVEAEAPAIEEAPAVGAEAAVAEEAAETEEAPNDAVESDEVEAAEAPAEEEASAVEVELFDDARAVERHFAENHFDQAFEETNRAWVIGDIRGNLLSPGLLTLLKRGVAEEKRYPSNLMPLVCRQLSGRHVAVFKWNKKLKVGPSRPHGVPDDTKLSDRPQAIIDHLSKNSGITLKDFWEAVMPADVTAEQKHEWLQDFQWLLGQGHIILLSDTSVHIAKAGDSAPSQKKSARKSSRRKGQKSPAEKDVNEAPKDEAPKDEAPKDEAPKDEAPKDEAPKDEAPKDEAPKDEAPKDEAPKDETPKDETPKDETPKDEAPKDETPKDEAPKDETPKDEEE
jgi:hypothetical protein